MEAWDPGLLGTASVLVCAHPLSCTHEEDPVLPRPQRGCLSRQLFISHSCSWVISGHLQTLPESWITPSLTFSPPYGCVWRHRLVQTLTDISSVPTYTWLMGSWPEVRLIRYSLIQRYGKCGCTVGARNATHFRTIRKIKSELV